jgi:hypothetical protein
MPSPVRGGHSVTDVGRYRVLYEPVTGPTLTLG